MIQTFFSVLRRNKNEQHREKPTTQLSFAREGRGKILCFVAWNSAVEHGMWVWWCPNMLSRSCLEGICVCGWAFRSSRFPLPVPSSPPLCFLEMRWRQQTDSSPRQDYLFRCGVNRNCGRSNPVKSFVYSRIAPSWALPYATMKPQRRLHTSKPSTPGGVLSLRLDARPTRHG